MLEALWIALAGAIVYLDTTAVAQIMISQPLIACPALGLLMGQGETGLIFGLMFQLVWLGSLPVGAARFPEGNVGALVATAIACSTPGLVTPEPSSLTIAFAVIAGILTAELGSEVTVFVRRILADYTDRTVEAAATGHASLFRARYLGAIGVHAVAGFVLTLAAFLVARGALALLLGDRSESLFASLPKGLQQSVAGIPMVMLGAGVAVIITRFVRKGNLVWFGGATIVGLAVGMLWR